MFEWKPQFSVGISSIDGQHQNLFALARELYDAMGAGQGKAAVGRILDRLVKYTAVHFAHEERLMKESAYPNFEIHRKEHETLTRQVLAFQVEFESGRQAMSIQLLQFLKGWLEHHIQAEDAAYAPYVQHRGVA